MSRYRDRWEMKSMALCCVVLCCVLLCCVGEREHNGDTTKQKMNTITPNNETREWWQVKLCLYVFHKYTKQRNLRMMMTDIKLCLYVFGLIHTLSWCEFGYYLSQALVLLLQCLVFCLCSIKERERERQRERQRQRERERVSKEKVFTHNTHTYR